MVKSRHRKSNPLVRKRTVKANDRLANSKTSVMASSPLSRYLEHIFQPEESRLATIATEIAQEPFDENRFRNEIIEKLRSLRYPQPEERPTDNDTFYERLNKAGCLKIVLSHSTLLEIWQCMLIPRIVARDRYLEKEHLSAVGYPLTFHRKLVREARKRLKEIDGLEAQFGPTAWLDKYRKNLDHQFHENIILDLLSRRYTGSREELLSGQSKSQLGHVPWDEQLAAKVAVYWILRTRLLETSRISDRFIMQLSLLLNAQLGEKLESEDALRHAIADDLLGWKKLLKIPSKK